MLGCVTGSFRARICCRGASAEVPKIYAWLSILHFDILWKPFTFCMPVCVAGSVRVRICFLGAPSEVPEFMHGCLS